MARDKFGMRVFARLCAAALVFAAAERAGAETGVASLKFGRRIVCPGEYRGHLQGIATDGKSIYWVFTRLVVKTDLNGKAAAKAKLPHHGGDPC